MLQAFNLLFLSAIFHALYMEIGKITMQKKDQILEFRQISISWNNLPLTYTHAGPLALYTENVFSFSPPSKHFTPISTTQSFKYANAKSHKKSFPIFIYVIDTANLLQFFIIASKLTLFTSCLFFYMFSSHFL